MTTTNIDSFNAAAAALAGLTGEHGGFHDRTHENGDGEITRYAVASLSLEDAAEVLAVIPRWIEVASTHFLGLSVQAFESGGFSLYMQASIPADPAPATTEGCGEAVPEAVPS